MRTKFCWNKKIVKAVHIQIKQIDFLEFCGIVSYILLRNTWSPKFLSLKKVFKKLQEWNEDTGLIGSLALVPSFCKESAFSFIYTSNEV